MEKDLILKLLKNSQTISTMESCTGGLLAASITNVDDSSQVFKFGAITYSNEYKVKFGIKEDTLKKYSVYSNEISREMSKCISDYTMSDYGVGITGKLNKKDIFNLNGEDNIVFISIYDRNKNTFEDIILKVPLDERSIVKKYIVKEVIQKLIDLI